MVTTNQNPTKGHTKNKENRTQTNKRKEKMHNTDMQRKERTG